MSQQGEWSSSWKSSSDPSKQRKYRENAPLHVKDKLLSANLAPELREELGTRSFRLRTGDRVKVMRGDRSGESGIVTDIDRSEERVYVDGITVERQNGTESEIPLRPSNLQIEALNVDDMRRLEKYDVDDFAEIEVDEEAMEEAMEEDEQSEMMQQMQSGDSSVEVDTEEEEEEEQEEVEEETEEEEQEPEDEEADEDEEASEPAGEEAGPTADYNELASNTIDDFKGKLEEIDDPDYQAALEAEEENKDRKTMKEWLERRVEE